MKRPIRVLAVLLLVLAIYAGGARAMCQICYQQSFLGIHYTTWDTLPDSCSNWILLDPSATCANLLAAAPPAPGKFESIVTWLDGSGILDSLDTGAMILRTLNHGQIVVRPVVGQPGQLEYANLPGSPYPPANGPIIYAAVRPGRPLHYPPIAPIAGGSGPTCSGPAGTDFCLAYTQLHPSTHQVTANQLYPIDIQTLTFQNVNAAVPVLSDVGIGAMVLVLLGIGTAVMFRRT